MCGPGCGGYADNSVGAVSTTGEGEAIMKVTLARLVLFYMERGKTHTHTHILISMHRKNTFFSLGSQVSQQRQEAMQPWPT